MEELAGTESRAPRWQRCADCGKVLEEAADRAAVCQTCGEPLCRDCAGELARRDEAMICVDCWERDYLSSEDWRATEQPNPQYW